MEKTNQGATVKSDSNFERVDQHANVVRCFGGRLHLSVDNESGYYAIEELTEMDVGTFFEEQKKRKKITFGYLLSDRFVDRASAQTRGDSLRYDARQHCTGSGSPVRSWQSVTVLDSMRAHSYMTAGTLGTVVYSIPELCLLGMYTRCAEVREDKLDIISCGIVTRESFSKRSPIDPLGVQDLMAAEKATPSNAEVTVVGTDGIFQRIGLHHRLNIGYADSSAVT